MLENIARTATALYALVNLMVTGAKAVRRWWKKRHATKPARRR